jgi:hypothetical protein
MPAGLRKYEKDGFTKGGHEHNWKYAKTVTHAKTGTVAAFEYISKEPHKRKNYRGDDREVEIGPKNFLTRNLLGGRTATSLVIHPDGQFEY